MISFDWIELCVFYCAGIIVGIGLTVLTSVITDLVGGKK